MSTDGDLTKLEEEIAQEIVDAVNDFSAGTARSQQSAENRVGVSDIGHCKEKVRRMVVEAERTDERGYTEAFIGTAVGDELENALKIRNPDYITQGEVEIELPSGVVLTGHFDLLDPKRQLLIDIKTVNGTANANRPYTQEQQRFQRHLYALGCIQAGMVEEEGLLVGNAWFDRGGKDKTPVVKVEPFDRQVIVEADEWISDVIYAVRMGEETERSKPRDFCERFCEFYSGCRGQDTDVSGLMESADDLHAMAEYRRAMAMESEAKRLKNSAKIALKGASGVADLGDEGMFTLRWVHVNETVTAPVHRGAYQKIDIRRVPPKRK